jgi:hypothetical protein
LWSRIYCTKKFLDNNKGQVTFVKTEAVWADGASKPLQQPGKYASFAQFVLGDATTSQPVGVVILNGTV